MTVAIPWVLWVTGLSVLGLVAAHLLSVGRPPVLVLPTARFVPEGALESVSRARRPSDLALLLVRVLALLLAGAAFADVRMAPSRVPVASVAVLDGFAQPDTTAWRAAMRQAFDGLVRDSSWSLRAAVLWDGRVLRGEAGVLRAALDTIALDGDGDAARMPSRSAHSLAGALLSARRLAPSLAPFADSLALVVVSPLREDATSDALRAVRSAWPGRIAFVSPPALARAPDTASVLAPARDRVAVRAREGDAVLAAFRLAGALPAAPTRVVRLGLTADDSTFARNGGVLVWWPDAMESDSGAARAAAANAAPANAAPADSGGAVIANGRALVAPLPRTRRVHASPTTLAWWPDGAPAISEEPLGVGCVRTVGFAPPGGDALLNASARGVLSALAAPCTTAAVSASAAPLPADLIVALRDSGPLVAADEFRSQSSRDASPLVPWLIAGALACLLLEQWMRVRRGQVRGAAA